MYKRILIPLDGSTLASAVLPCVRPIVQCSGAQIVLLQVVPEIGMRIGEPAPPAVQADKPVGSAALEVAHYESAARAYLEQVAAELAAAGIAAHVRVVTGPVTESILEVASAENVDLIAMSTHGRGGLGRFLLGSVASQVVHYAKSPVLLVRAAADEPQQPTAPHYRKILTPLDGSEFSQAILPHVREVAACVGAHVVLLQAIPEPEPVVGEAGWVFTFGGIAAADPDTRRQLVESTRAELARRAELEMEAAQSNLNGAAAFLKSAGVAVETLVQMGRPAEVILDVAKANGVDMIAMATHGRSGIQRLLLGSVADRIIRHAHVPVLLVRPQSANA